MNSTAVSLQIQGVIERACAELLDILMKIRNDESPAMRRDCALIVKFILRNTRRSSIIKKVVLSVPEDILEMHKSLLARNLALIDDIDLLYRVLFVADIYNNNDRREIIGFRLTTEDIYHLVRKACIDQSYTLNEETLKLLISELNERSCYYSIKVYKEFENVRDLFDFKEAIYGFLDKSELSKFLALADQDVIEFFTKTIEANTHNYKPIEMIADLILNDIINGIDGNFLNKIKQVFRNMLSMEDVSKFPRIRSLLNLEV